MVRVVLAPDVVERFDEVADAVRDTNEPVIVERDGTPQLVLLSPDEFERLRRQDAERAWAVIERVQERNAERDPDAVLADVTAVVEEIRQERYDERQRAGTRRP
jgi:prevent-host-death family protein